MEHPFPFPAAGAHCLALAVGSFSPPKRRAFAFSGSPPDFSRVDKRTLPHKAGSVRFWGVYP